MPGPDNCHPTRESRWRRWIPSPGTAGLLAGLTLLTALLRGAVVSSKALTRAAERWAEARATPGVSFKWEDAAVLGTHCSTAAALVILPLALLTLRWWHPANVEKTTPAPPPAPGARSKWFLPALIGLVLAGAALRLPLAAGSLWWDELWNVKFATLGEWRQDEANPDKAHFQPTSWKRAAWYYNKPTNHPVLTLPSKAAHQIWKGLTKPADPGAFHEIVLRSPVLLAGLGGILLTALLTRRLAGERAALLAAAIMALHPWLIRYGVDARSYGFSIAFMAAALFSLERATAADSARPGLFGGGFSARVSFS